MKLPTNKWIIEWISISCNERTTPINLIKKIFYFEKKWLRFTFKPIISRSRLTWGGKYEIQYCGSANRRISSSSSIPKLRIICHWYFSPPLFAAALVYSNNNGIILRYLKKKYLFALIFVTFTFFFFICIHRKFRWKTKFF